MFNFIVTQCEIKGNETLSCVFKSPCMYVEIQHCEQSFPMCPHIVFHSNYMKLVIQKIKESYLWIFHSPNELHMKPLGVRFVFYLKS